MVYAAGQAAKGEADGGMQGSEVDGAVLQGKLCKEVRRMGLCGGVR